MLFFLSLVAAARAGDELPEWMRNCRVRSEKSVWYPKLIEARRRVNAAGLAWDDATCTVTVPEALAMYGFCDVDTRGSDRGIGDVVPRETCVIDARVDRLSSLSALVARAEAAAREAREQAAFAAEESRLARGEAASANGAAAEAARQASQAGRDSADAKLAAEGAARDAKAAREEAELVRKALEEARRLAAEAAASAERAETSARNARQTGGYFLAQGGGLVILRNEVVMPYGKNGVLPEGYDASELMRRRTLRTSTAGGTIVGIDAGFAWPAVQFGLSTNAFWCPEETEDDSFETVSTNGFGAMADLRLSVGSGTWKVGGGPSVVVAMLGQDLSATPAINGVTVGGMLEVRYLATEDRRWQTVAFQIRAGNETFNTSVRGYEQTREGAWMSASLLVGIGGGPEVGTNQKKGAK